MDMMNIKEDEYSEYYKGYISYSNGIDLFNLLRANADEVNLLLTSLSEEDALYSYEHGKWAIKEVFGHIIDTERIFGYRALAIARGEQKPIAGYDHDTYVKNADFNHQTLSSLLSQYQTAREATIALFHSFTDEQLLRKGIANNNTFSVRALGYTIAGHEIHHLNILAERYLTSFEGDNKQKSTG